MYRDISEKLLGRQESALSFHVNQQNEQMPITILTNLNTQWLYPIYVIAQLLQLMIGYYLVQQIDIITISTQRSIVTVILCLAYIQCFDHQQFQFEKNYMKIFTAMAITQVIASLIGLFTMQQFTFSEVCTFHQLTAGYMFLFQHMLIQPVNNINLLISLIQTLSTILFSAGILFIFLCLLQPLCLAFIQTLKYLMTKQLQQFNILLYTNLIGLPIYIILSIFSGKASNMIDFTYFIEIIIMVVLQLIAYLAINELIKQQNQQMYSWALSGIVTILSLVVQLAYHQTSFGYEVISIFFIVITSIAMHRQ